MNPCTSYWISVVWGIVFQEYSIPKIPFWGIGKLLGTISILSGCLMSETWIEPSDSTKFITSIICNLSSLRIYVPGCIFLALIRLGSVPVSIMKTRSGSSPSRDIVVMGEAENFFGFITATLRSSPLVPSLESLSHSPDVSCWGPLEIRPLASRDSASFAKNYSVNYCIDDILQFRALYSYNNGTVWGCIRFLFVPIHYSYYLLIREIHCYIVRTNPVGGNRFFEGGLGGG